MAKTRVFVSHISAESAIAQALKQRLQRDFLGLLDIFVSSDQTTIRAGEKWLAEVEKALKAADVLLLIASPESVGRPWVNFEAGAVWLRGIPVIPICHSGMTPVKLPVPLSLLQAVTVDDAVGLRRVYDALAAELKVDTPAVDFAAAAAELKALQSSPSAPALEVIREPRILVGSNAQYAEPSYGLDYDIAAIEGAFPGRSTVERALTSRRLRELLIGHSFDILHLALPIHPRTGELVFSEVDYHSNEPLPGTVDAMPIDAFVSLVTETKARLVVIATCQVPLVVAQEVQKVAHMAASDDMLTGEQAKEWAECCYGMLAGGRSVHKAFALTQTQVKVPMRMFEHPRDVAFEVAR